MTGRKGRRMSACVISLRLIRVVIAVLATSMVLNGQLATSTITGRVTDASGGVIPDGAVRLTNDASGISTQSITNEVGLYRFGNLVSGSYRIEVEASGFQRLVRRGIVLQVSQVLQLDLSLELGSVTETIEVMAASPVVEAQSSSVSQLVERSMIEGMPLVSRSAAALVVLTPGATVINPAAGRALLPIFSVGGGRVRNQQFSLDGGNVNNIVGLAVPQNQGALPMDAMQEFRIITNNYSAEHGNSSGGVITLSTRAGTNAFHGSLFEYVRNDAFNARNFFATSKPRLRLHQFGGALGGPIKKDKTHFFTSWEQTREVTGSTVFQTVPDNLQRIGDFSTTLNRAGGVIPIYDPLTTVGRDRQQFPDNRIPSGRIDSVATASTEFWPLPNRAGTVTGSNNFSANSRPEATRNIVVARVDHQIRPEDQIMVRFYVLDVSTENRGVFPRLEADPSATHGGVNNSSILGAHTHTFSPSLINEVRFTSLRRKGPNISFGFGQDFAGQLGLRGVSDQGFPIFRITGFAGLGREPFRGSVNPEDRPIYDLQWQDALSYYRGKHALKVGVEHRRGYFYDNRDFSSSGDFRFTPLITALPGVSNTGNAFASFMLGEANAASTVRPDIIDSDAQYWALYVQDDWRITDRLTLNLGLRWDVNTPRRETNNRQNSFDLNVINPVSGTAGVVTFAGRDGVPRTAFDADYNNFGPRFGFAYRLPGVKSTIIRGGGGIMYGQIVSDIIGTAASLGFSTDVRLVATQPGFNSAAVLREGFPAVPRVPVEELGAGFGAVPVGERPTTAVTFFERTRPTPYSLQYNFDIQHELRTNLLLELGYAANLSHHLTGNGDLTVNQVPAASLGPGNAQVRRPFPQFSNVAVINPPVGNSTYHAFTVKTEKRYSEGLTFLAHYTFSKFIDDVRSFSEFGDPGRYMDAYNRHLDKSLSGSDVRHRAVISGVYELPFLSGRSGLVSAFGGWKVGAIVTFQSGPPFTVFNNRDETNSFPAGTVRPDLLGDPELQDSQRTIGRWFNTAAFQAPGPFRFGTAPRSVLRGPGISTIDLSLQKVFSIREPWKVEFRGEFFNLLNHTNFGIPGHTFGTPAFGVIRTTRPARTIQLALRITF